MIFYSVQEVSAQFKVSDDTVIGLIKAQELTAVKIGNQWRISDFDLKAYVKKQTIQSRKSLKQTAL